VKKEEILIRIKKLFDELSQETDQLAEQLVLKEKTIAEQVKEIEVLSAKVQGFEAVGREVLGGMRKLEVAITEPEHLKLPSEIASEQGQEEAEANDIDLGETPVDLEFSEDLEDNIISIQEAVEEKDEKVGAQGKKGLYEKMFGQ
jgi:hypothetical protein